LNKDCFCRIQAKIDKLEIQVGYRFVSFEGVKIPEVLKESVKELTFRNGFCPLPSDELNLTAFPLLKSIFPNIEKINYEDIRPISNNRIHDFDLMVQNKTSINFK
jgi:hypothetical protein